MRTGFLFLTLSVVFPVTAADGRYDNRLTGEIMDLSQRMATCAGRQEASAKWLEGRDKPSNAELARRLGIAYGRCSLYLRHIYSAKKAAPDQNQDSLIESSKKAIESETDLAQLYMGAMLETDRYDEARQQLDECRELAEEALACINDQNRLIEELRERGQKEATPSQPGPTPANSGR